MKLIKSFEKYRKHQLQVIEVVCEVSSREDINDLSYEDYQVNLFINHKFVADISHVLDDAGMFTEMVDKIDWEEIYQDSQFKHAV
jgi:SepF-like predicted cell division protein (DUF552 family)